MTKRGNVASRRASRGLAPLALWLALSALACSDRKEDDRKETEPEAGAGELNLRQVAAAAGKLLGTAVDADALRADPTYAEVLAREFDTITPENATKWGPLAPTEDSYAWEDADAIVEFAEEHSQAIKGHAFVWHRQAPSWLSSSMSADELRAALKSHIETTLARYKGRVRAWDVVNEAVDVTTESGYTASVFLDVLGPSYIEEAFRLARAADPDVLLFYNEVGIERMGAKSDFTYELMKELLDRGVPIDGIGLQSHVSTHRYPALSDLRANIRRFADLGLIVNISELDARTLLMPGDGDSRRRAQRIAFQQVVSACVSEPGCEGVTLWGFTDRYTWINDEGGEPDEPLIFDRDYRRKPAYRGVLDGLSGALPALGDNLVSNGDFAAGTEAWAAAGELSIRAAMDRSGAAACVSDQEAGLVQEGLLPALAQGGPFSFAAFVRVEAAGEATIDAELVVEDDTGETRTLSVATLTAQGQEWREIAGYVGLGFEPMPSGIALRIFGSSADAELCIADVRLQPLAP